MSDHINESTLRNRKNDLLKGDSSRALKPLILFLVPAVDFHSPMLNKRVPFVISDTNRRSTPQRSIHTLKTDMGRERIARTLPDESR